VPRGREGYGKALESLLADRAGLERFLLARSGLPGPRANLELAAALADLFERQAPGRETWGMLIDWSSLRPDEAPANARRVFLPFAALQAMGACHHASAPERRAEAVRALKRAARDPRWRIREAAVFGFQRIAGRDFRFVRDPFSEWYEASGMFEKRCILVALAHPPLLEREGAVELALELAGRAMREIARLPPSAGRTEECRVLRKGLEFAPSVYAAADPDRGFAALAEWAREEAVEVKKIVASNLRKARLARRFPERVEEVGAILSSVG
jgi:hypothetical protein